MTREEAIAKIKDHKIVHKMNEPRAILISEALDMAIKALGQQSEDCISRQAVLDLINADWKYEGLEIDVASLPSVQPKPKTGHWIPVTEKLPKADETVLVSLAPLPNCIKQIAISSMFDNKTWRIKATVDAWMPLPEPY